MLIMWLFYQVFSLVLEVQVNEKDYKIIMIFQILSYKKYGYKGLTVVVILNHKDFMKKHKKHNV